MISIILFVLQYTLTSANLEVSAMKNKVIWVNEIYFRFRDKCNIK